MFNSKIISIPPQGRVETSLNDSVFFIDFEFDNFKDLNPLSIGLCSLDRKHTFYREFKADYKGLNDWVLSNVVAHFEGNPQSEDKIKEELNSFLRDFDNIMILSDHPFDLQILSKLNPYLDKPVLTMLFTTYVLSKINYPIVNSKNFQEKFEEFSTIVAEMEHYNQYFVDCGIIQHHALNDTKVMATLLERGFNNARNKNQP